MKKESNAQEIAMKWEDINPNEFVIKGYLQGERVISHGKPSFKDFATVVKIKDSENINSKKKFVQAVGLNHKYYPTVLILERSKLIPYEQIEEVRKKIIYKFGSMGAYADSLGIKQGTMYLYFFNAKRKGGARMTKWLKNWL